VENIIYADATIEIDIQKVVDEINELKETIRKLENTVEDLDGIVGEGSPDFSNFVTKDELLDEIKQVLREDVTISVEIDC